MASNEKFCLRWNDFESNISVAFRELRDDKDFFDVTLACDDDQIQAHKVILSACSPFFRQILKRNKHDHPLLYLKGVKYIDLMSVLNFMYHGEVNVAQDELNSFLAIAEDLKVKGLTQNKTSDNISHKQDRPISKHQRSSERSMTPTFSQRQRPAALQDAVAHVPTSAQPTSVPQDDDIQEVVPVKSEPVGHIPETQLSNPHQETPNHVVDPLPVDNQMAMYEENYDNYETYEEGGEMNYDGSMISIGNTDANKGEQVYENILRGMIETITLDCSDSAIQCKICQRSFKPAQTTNLKTHIEAKHLDHIKFNCSMCGGTFSSKASFNTHTRNFHKDSQPVAFTVTAHHDDDL